RCAAASAASCAANGVLLREPLKPTLPELAHESVFPCRSVNVMIVLLNDDLMCAIPYATFLRSFFFGRRPPAAGFAPAAHAPIPCPHLSSALPRSPPPSPPSPS